MEIDKRTTELLSNFGGELETNLKRRIRAIRQGAFSLLGTYGTPNVRLLPLDPTLPVSFQEIRRNSRIRYGILPMAELPDEKEVEKEGGVVKVLIERARKLDPIQPFRALAQFSTDIAFSEIEAEMEKSLQVAYQCLLNAPLKEIVIPMEGLDDSSVVIYSWEPTLLKKLASIANSEVGTVDAEPEQFSKWSLKDCHIRFTTSPWGYGSGMDWRDEHYLDIPPRIDNIVATKSTMPHSSLRRIKQAEAILHIGQKHLNDLLNREFEYPADLT